MKQEIVSSNNMINVSFQQKSAGVSLVIISSVAAYYIAHAWPMRPIALAGTAIPDGYGNLVLSTLALIIVTEIVLQIVLVIGSGAAPAPTLRERTAVLKANRNAYNVLTVGVLAVVGLLFVGFPAFCMANIAIISLAAAEITKFASQLFFYRQSA